MFASNVVGTLTSGTPRAKAARTNGAPIVSAIACACRRSNIAVSGLSEHGAVVTWATSAAATGAIEFGASAGQPTTIPLLKAETSHTATLAGLWFQGRLERTKSRRDVVGTFVASEAGAIKAVAYAVGRPDEKKGFEHLEAARERIGRLAEASHAEAFQTLS